MLVVVAKDICGIQHTVQWVCALSSDINRISTTVAFGEFTEQRTKRKKKNETKTQRCQKNLKFERLCIYTKYLF